MSPWDKDTSITAVRQIAAVPTILDTVCRLTGMGFAAVARVSDDRWIACGVKDDIAFGLEPGGELGVETTICNEIRQSFQPVVINHVAQDACYTGHPTPAMYGFQSYISMPIVLPDGTFFGTLCAIDPRAARLDAPGVVETFRIFAELIAFQLDAFQRVSEAERRLRDEQAMAEFREQFIAVLGHDLRNPLAAIDGGTRLLSKGELSDKSHRILTLMQGSVARMATLIDNVLDFARGRLGEGFKLDRKPRQRDEVSAAIRQVVDELQAASPKRRFDIRIVINETVTCDLDRLEQLLSNLLGNAVTYGNPEQPILVEATTQGGDLEIAVGNGGSPIPEVTMARLFQPFFRGEDRKSQQGLGLGLHIASEIARAHGGGLEVKSDAVETKFTFRMAL